MCDACLIATIDTITPRAAADTRQTRNKRTDPDNRSIRRRLIAHRRISPPAPADGYTECSQPPNRGEIIQPGGVSPGIDGQRGNPIFQSPRRGRLRPRRTLLEQITRIFKPGPRKVSDTDRGCGRGPTKSQGSLIKIVVGQPAGLVARDRGRSSAGTWKTKNPLAGASGSYRFARAKVAISAVNTESSPPHRVAPRC